jgi:3-deoxy-D-arabino-heptulosonate 7-phosphate (DAHP) synthase
LVAQLNPRRKGQTFQLSNIMSILVKLKKAEIFQVGERNIKNHKMIDNRGNAKIALPLYF